MDSASLRYTFTSLSTAFSPLENADLHGDIGTTLVSSLKDGLISLSVRCSTTAKVRSMTDEQLEAMHRLLAEYHRKLAQQATLDVVQQYHADLGQRLADEAVLIPRRTAIAERLHEREQKIAKDGGENE